MRWSRVLTVVAVAGAALLALAAVAARLGQGTRSPFEGLLPADTPLVVEGEAAAVLEALRSSPGPGPQALEEFGLSHSLAGETRRMLVALLPGTSEADAGLCRAHLARVVDGLESAWEDRQAYPATAPALGSCPAGGTLSYRPEGEDFVLECQGSTHRVAYASREGFIEGTGGGPALLVAVEKGREQALQASLVPQATRDLRLFCTRPELLDQLLCSRGPRLDLPGPASAPLRLSAEARQFRSLFPRLSPQVPDGGRIEAWGDPAEGRWSARLPLALPAQAPAEADPASLLAELPTSPVAVAGSPALLEVLGLGPTGLATGASRRPTCVGFTTAAPLVRGQERQQLDRAVAGRASAQVAARFETPGQVRPWLQASPWAALLQAGHPGGQVDLRGGTAILRLGAESPSQGSRPTLPAGPGDAALAGWATVVSPGTRADVYGFCAGWDGGRLWVEIDREAASGAASQARGDVPQIEAR